MIGVIDYGLGNVEAFLNIYKRLNITASAISKSDQLHKSSHLILPGVGAFDWAMKLLNDSGLRGDLDDLVLKKKIPVLGVCVGMQIMSRGSAEGGEAGLDWIPSDVLRLDHECNETVELPHMGWNEAVSFENKGLFKGIVNPRFYFLHSYYIKPDSVDYQLSTTSYHFQFVSSVRFNNVYGTQFHPEKSHGWGIQLLKNFSEL